uniref:ATPase AAA-type core domain-containing protein n=1 Tax=Desulfovibrio sp. U5L TaxID=596152 RepID=I2PZ35_9BACT
MTAISVAGFKSISREQTLHIAPLTILAGANSSGKSSMMQPLLLMKQTLEAPYDPGVFLLDGPNVRFTKSDQILSFDRSNVSSTFKVTLHSIFGSVGTAYAGNDVNSFDIHSVEYFSSFFKKIVFEKGMTEKELEKRASQSERFSDENLSEIKYFVEIVRRCFLDIFAVSWIQGDEEIGDFFSEQFFYIYDMIKISKNIIHLPGLRGNPERTYRTSNVGRSYPGTFENYVASIIYYWQQKNQEHIQVIGRYLEALTLTTGVFATSIDATQVEIKVGRLPKSTKSDTADLVNIADVGVGVSQTLPVLVALLAAEPGQIVYIEQPEIHLHPLAQYRLAAVIAEASKRGVLVIIETHSDILIRGVQTLVAEGNLDPAIVKLHWFSRSPEDGSTTVTCAELDENGAFGDWPQDFDMTALNAEKAYLDAVETRLSRDGK